MLGIDGKVELSLELRRLSAESAIAAGAPRGTGLAKYLADGLNVETESGIAEGPYWTLTSHLLQRLSIWWSPAGYSSMPVMTPWCIRDRSARYDQGPEMWGAPRADGYLRDDNSVIEKLPLPLFVKGTPASPYTARKPWRGFTACHIWRALEDGSIGGVDQWIYSFMPNLVWLPSPISALTDHHPRIQAFLQRTSQTLFRGAEGQTTASYANYVWNRLVPVSSQAEDGPSLDISSLALFDTDARFISRRLDYIDRFVTGADEVLACGTLSRKLICTRYTVGMPLLETEALEAFRAELGDYWSAVRAGL